jgi:hypothetical protein
VTLIPSIGFCVSRMTSGERRLAERLEQKLDDDYLPWYDVPVGPKQSPPDLVALMGVGQMPAAGEDERAEARLFYVGATRATHRLVISVGGDERFGRKLSVIDRVLNTTKKEVMND